MNIKTLELPKQVLEVISKLSEHGYDAYIYGRCVRELTKESPLDFEVAVNAEFSRVRAIFEGYNVNEENLDKEELLVRVLGVAINVKSCADLEKLLSKTAFTFDAVAYNPEKGFVDPFGGLKHMEENTVAFVSQMNPLDILPALGLYSEEERKIEETSKIAILAFRNNLSPEVTPPELTREDFEKILMSKRAGEILTEFEKVFAMVIPELNILISFKHIENLPFNAFKSVGCSSPLLTLRLALLFHELGAPDCYSRDSDDVPHYYGSGERSRIYAERIMLRMNYDKYDIKETGYIISNYQKIAEKVAELGENKNARDLAPLDYPQDLLKLLLLFNYAIVRAQALKDNDPKVHEAMVFKKLASQIN